MAVGNTACNDGHDKRSNNDPHSGSGETCMFGCRGIGSEEPVYRTFIFIGVVLNLAAKVAIFTKTAKKPACK